MIEVLRIRNFAIIDHLEVEFQPGLTAITGETGAGKSVLLGALKLLLGERAAGESIRTGADRATVEATFRPDDPETLAWLDAAGLGDDSAEGTVLLRREILASGTSRGFVNGAGATLAQMKELGSRLVDLHAQHEHTHLFSPAHQMRLLDGFGPGGRESDAYRQAHRDWRDAETRLRGLSADSGESERRRDYLAFQIDEIDKASPNPGEDDALEAEKRRLANAERLLSACRTALDLLYEGDRTESPAGALVSNAAKALAEVAALDPSQEPLAREAEAVRFAVEDLAEKVRDYTHQVSADPDRLALADDRLATLRGLKKKYGATLAEVLATRDGLAADLAAIANRGMELSSAREAHDAALDRVIASARALRSRRLAAAAAFRGKVEKEMRELELPKAVFEIRLETALPDGASAAAPPPHGALGVSGADTIEFMVSLNPGEDVRPLRKVASGGEIARIMLAVKAVLADRDDVPTFIFDEIDVGISGQAAARVGEKLRGLAKHHQVFCITHLPVVAAQGDHHLQVEKSVKGGRTTTSVRALGPDERREALARMLGGHDVDETGLRYADKLLARSPR